MTKMKSKKGAWLKALMAVPVLAILLIAYTAHSNTIPVGDPVRIKGKVVEAESGELLPGVSVLWKGHTIGTVTDMSGDFMLELPDKNPVLTYSFVGFKTATTKGAGPFTVKMERKTFQITEPVTEAAKVTTKKGESKEKAVIKDIPGSKEVFYIVEDMPKFQGGDYNTCKEYVQKHLEYPQEAKAKGLQGIVHVFFVVNGKGKVSNAKVKWAVDPQLDKAALKAVNSMPDWTPGRQREKPVAVQFEIPVEFKL